MERVRRIGKIRHVHHLQTLEERQDIFNNAVEKIKNSNFPPREQEIRIQNLRKAHKIDLAPQKDLFVAPCTK